MHTQIQTWLIKPLIILLTVLLVACGGGGGSDGPTITGTGKFVDGPVKGLSYRTNSASGETNESGIFRYVPGEEITFSYAGVDLGTALATDLMTPWDLVKQDDLEIAELALINMLRLLQSLDSNEDHSDGIQLFVLTEIIKNVGSINFHQGLQAFEEDYNLSLYLTNIAYSIIEIDVITLVSAQEAVTKFKETIEEENNKNPGSIVIPVSLDPDTDGDGVLDSVDNCPFISNPNQENTDGDSAGNVCDAFPDDANETVDADGDGVGNNSDNCPIAANPNQENDDDDALGNACDTDDDNDGVTDTADNCRIVANPNQDNNDGDDLGDACDPDNDNDGVEDSFPDNCPLISNADQLNTDGDLFGNACDPDNDNDGVADIFPDNCPLISNADQLNTDGDLLGNACDTDDDNDGVEDIFPDNCPLISNADQLDTDGDLLGNACDPDIDNDTYLNENDAFPLDPTEWLDTDSDSVGDNADNCPLISNADQSDVDDDGLGDVCDNDNGVPTAVNDSINVVANSSNNVIDALANDDFGVDGAGTFIIAVAPTNGVATIDDNATPDNSADDTIIYTPTTNYLGSDTLTYTITDASGSEASATVNIEVILELLSFNVAATNDPKVLRFTWTGDGLSAGDHFSLQVDPDGSSGFTAVAGGSNIDIEDTSFDLEIPVHLTDWVNAEYRIEVQADDNSVLDSFDLLLVNEMASVDPIGYFKSNNTQAGDQFGYSVAISDDGLTMAVGANYEDGNARDSGAVYVFVKSGNQWSFQEYLKASNPGIEDKFGSAIALSLDGNTLAVGAPGESSNGVGVDSGVDNNLASNSGAVYVFTRVGSGWSQQAFVKPSNTRSSQEFGGDLDISSDGSSLIVGAEGEASSATGVNGDDTLFNAGGAGAAYVFNRVGVNWSQNAYLKASNAEIADKFGHSVSISKDGAVLAVGAINEDSAATDINGTESDNNVSFSGAVYVFRKNISDEWVQNAYVKSSNTGTQAQFGSSIDLNTDGSFMAVGSSGEKSASTGIDGDQSLSTSAGYGAVYLFSFDGTDWSQDYYVKANFMLPGSYFGAGVALSSDGDKLFVSAPGEESRSDGIDSDASDTSGNDVGAAYAFELTNGIWAQTSYIKSSNSDSSDNFGGDYTVNNNTRGSIAVSADGKTLAVGAYGEGSSSIGINGVQNDNSASRAGAVYLY